MNQRQKAKSKIREILESENDNWSVLEKLGVIDQAFHIQEVKG